VNAEQDKVNQSPSHFRHPMSSWAGVFRKSQPRGNPAEEEPR
jgi:hypothetical protein